MDPENIHYYNPRGETEVWQNRLPHWQQDQAVYFVTFHLADSLPHVLLKQLERERAAWLEHHPKPWEEPVAREYHSRFDAAKERWLDEGHGSCALRSSGCRSVVGEALKHFDGSRHRQITFVIMPNHGHSLFMLSAGVVLEDLLHSWKSFSSKTVNSLLCRSGPFWQKDYFDRLIRDGQHLDNCIRYIRRNPAKAKLREEEFTLFESDFARSVM